jgi:hypothetical protein
MKAVATRRAIHALVVLLGLCAPLTVLAQGGSLTPSGPPGATMLSLREMEPRTPLVAGAPGVRIGASGTITISASGSYHLAGNLTVTSGNGITVDAAGVTLDLRGFTITSTAANAYGAGVDINAGQVTVCNGRIVSGTTYDSQAGGDQYTGPGFDDGVNASGSTVIGIRVHDITVSGCDRYGIYCANRDDSQVSSCTVNTAGSTGINGGRVAHCSAQVCGGVAIYAKVVTACQGASTGNDGISAVNVAGSYGYASGTNVIAEGILAAETAQNSYGYSASGDGIVADTAMNCRGITTSTSTVADGITAGCVQNSYGRSMGGDGIRASAALNCYGYTEGTGAQSDGIDASYCVQNSIGYTKGGDGIQAYIASFCRGTSHGTDADADGVQATIGVACMNYGGEDIANKYLMP